MYELATYEEYTEFIRCVKYRLGGNLGDTLYVDKMRRAYV